MTLSATSRFVSGGSSTGSAPRAISVTVFVSDPNPEPSCVISLATIRSRFLRRSLSAAFSRRFSVSAAKPTRILSPFLSPSSARISGFLASYITSGPSDFLIFCFWKLSGR